ncbi:MAG: nucleotidyltransferase [Clostridia bacterium]|nr:nucleotidyltransferase [Clostridia bacterium]
MMKTSLVILAAGIGSRFGGGIKQLEHMGPAGEIIMHYSIYDALAAGFDRVVFIIRKDIEQDFKEIIGNEMEKICPCEYVFQAIDDLPEGYSVPEGRTKPWGTAQALLACRGVVNEPFIVINADDYYGKEGFKLIHDYLVEHCTDNTAMDFCMAGYVLENTLSENGGVSRGVCETNAASDLVRVTETHNITKTATGAAVPDGDGWKDIDPKSYVSMNMWGLTPALIDRLYDGFPAFLDSISDNPMKAEYLLPMEVDKLLQAGQATVKLLPTNDKWFGVTYKEDKPAVVAAIRKLIADGVYPSPLFQ